MIDIEQNLCYSEDRSKPDAEETAMISETRHRMILETLQQRGTVTAQELAELLHTSISTIRRDLLTLDSQGLLTKVHGGAALREVRLSSAELDMLTKEGLNTAQKQVIARTAAAMIRADDFVFIDAGSTTLQLVHALSGEALKAVYVTNGLAHTRALSQKGCSVYVPAGQVKQRTEAVIGATTLNSLRHYNFTKAFLGVNGVSTDHGYTTPSIEERELKEAALRASAETWFLADSSKFGKVFPAGICGIREAFLITDRLPDESYRLYTTVKEADPA